MPRRKRPSLDAGSSMKASLGTKRRKTEDSIGEPSSSQTYDKLWGIGDTAGPSYEQKISTLLFVQGIKSGRNFSLMSNMTAADKYDDVVFVDHDRDNLTLFIQLKHKKHNFTQTQGDGNTKETPFILSSKQLTSPDGDFSLLKYLDSYRKVKNKEMEGNADLKKCNFQNSRFLLFTNAILDTQLNHTYETADHIFRDLFAENCKYFPVDKVISEKLKELDDGISKLKESLAQLSRDIEQNPSIDGSESVAQSVKKIKDSLKGLQNIKQINIMMSQLVANPLKIKIDETLQKSEIFQVDRSLESFNEFLEKFLMCTDQPHESELDDIIKREIHTCWPVDPNELSRVYTSLLECVKHWLENENICLTAMSPIWTQALHRTRKDELASYKVSFTEEAVKSIVDKSLNTQGTGVILMTVDQPTLAMMKLHQSEEILEEYIRRPTFVLLSQKDRILSAWKSVWCSTLVVELKKPMDKQQALTLVKTLLQTAAVETLDRTTLDPNQKRKLLVLVLRKEHNMVEAVKQLTNNYMEVDCKFTWKDLTPESQNLLETKSVNFQGTIGKIKDLLQNRKTLASKLDGETVWQLLTTGTVELGKRLEAPIHLNISRSLTTNQDGRKPVYSMDDLPRVSLITGQPGIGKSTLFTELAHSTKKKDWLLWIIRLNLLDCSKYLQTIQRENTPIDAIAFVQNFAGNGDIMTSFEKALFTESMYEKLSKIVVFIDGADEISPHYEKEVMGIIEKLQKEQQLLQKLCVSCRSVMKAKVESILHINASEIIPFARQDTINYLVNFWRDKYKDISLDDVTKVANKFLSLEESSNAETLLTGKPLIVNMMAAILAKDILDYTNGKKKFPKRIKLFRLYSEFVKRTFNIFLEEKRKIQLDLSANKSKQDDEFKHFMRMHMLAALMCLDINDYDLITKANQNKMENEVEEFLERIKSGDEKTGIIDGITVSDQPQFIHQTFIEYFQAEWIHKHFNYIENNKLLQAVLFQPNFKVVNEMLNQMFVDEDKHPLHTSVLNMDLDSIKQLLKLTPDIVNSVDKGGRTALHLVAFDWGHHASIDIARLLLDHNASIDKKDKVVELTPLQVADKAQAWAMVSLILKHGGDGNTMLSTRSNISDENEFKEFTECLPDPHKNSMRLVVITIRYGMTSCLEYLVAQRGDCSILGHDEVSLMHLAATCGHVSVMKYLRSKGVLYSTPDSHNNVPMHSAVNNGSKDVLLFLMNQDEAKECLYAENNDGKTPVVLAIELFSHTLSLVKNLSDKKDFRFDHTDKYYDVIECLLRQEISWPEDTNAQLQREVKEYKVTKASLAERFYEGAPGIYNRMKGFSTTDGGMYEVKTSALLYMKGLNSGRPFQLASNVAGVGAYDDIIFRLLNLGDDRDNREHWSTYLFQLKHKLKANITLEALIAGNDFGLVKYHKSFLETRDTMHAGDQGDIFKGDFKNCHFVLLTNAPASVKLKKLAGITDESDSVDDVVKFGGTEYIFGLYGCQDIVSCLEGKYLAKEFLAQLKMFSGEPRVENMNKLISKEILKIHGFNQSGYEDHANFN